MNSDLVIHLLNSAAADARPLRIYLPGGSFEFTALDRPPLLDNAKGVVQLIGFPAPREGYAEGRLLTVYASLADISAVIMDFDFT